MARLWRYQLLKMFLTKLSLVILDFMPFFYAYLHTYIFNHDLKGFLLMAKI